MIYTNKDGMSSYFPVYMCFGVFAAFFLSAFFPVSAQTPRLPLKPDNADYYFEEVRFPEGAPIRNVEDLLQDKRGFIWMASSHGLIRYDGHDFKVFRHRLDGGENSIVDTELWSLRILGDTLLCVGATRGISLIDLRTGKISSLSEDENGNPVGYVHDFFPDTDGRVWMACLQGLYSLKSDLSAIIDHRLELPPIKKGNPAFAKRVYDIARNTVDTDLLMLGTECGLVAFDKKRNAVREIHPNKQAVFRRSLPPVYKIEEEGDFLWTKSWMSGIPRFDMRNRRWENFAYPDEKTNTNIWTASDFRIRNDKEIWVCDLDRGLYMYEKGGNSIKPLATSRNSQVLKNVNLKIFMQNDSTLWLANHNGIWKQNRRKGRFRILDMPYYYTWVMPVFHDETSGDYYFGMVHKTYGVAVWNSGTRRWRYLRTETGREAELNTYDIFKDGNGVIWVATGGRGLWYVDRKNNVLKPFSPPDKHHPALWNGTVYKIFEDSRKNLWIGTGRYGLACMDSSRRQVIYYENIPGDTATLMAGTHFRTIEEDRYGRIWIGCHTGFCIFDPSSGKFSRNIARKVYETGIKPGDTYSIVKDTAGDMWMTVTGQGLVRVAEKKKGEFRFKVFETNEGLKDLSVKYMTADTRGNLWIVNNGLLYFNPYDQSFMLVDDRNGLAENLGGDDRIRVDRYGNVFCGNQVGCGWLAEARKLSASAVSNLFIETVFVNGEPIVRENEEPFILSATDDQCNLTFRYTAVCFDEYNQVRYRYKLEGLEREWNPPTRNLEVRYTNLPPGKYRFVADVAYKGNWFGYDRSVSFEIREVFWKTWWFVVLTVFFVAAAVYTVCLNRKRHLEKQRRLRLKIASDLHDDVGSTLSSISIMSEILQMQPVAEGELPHAGEIIREIGANARNMLESMEDIIWSVIPSNDAFRNLILHLREYAIPLFELKNIGFKITAPETAPPLSIPMEIRRNVFLIAKEAVNNLVKYSDCTSAVIDLSLLHSVFRMRIEDNGKGFDVEKNCGRNGLRNMKYRAKKIGGKIDIHSSPGKGTCIVLSVKI